MWLPQREDRIVEDETGQRRGPDCAALGIGRCWTSALTKKEGLGWTVAASDFYDERQRPEQNSKT